MISLSIPKLSNVSDGSERSCRPISTEPKVPPQWAALNTTLGAMSDPPQPANPPVVTKLTTKG